MRRLQSISEGQSDDDDQHEDDEGATHPPALEGEDPDQDNLEEDDLDVDQSETVVMKSRKKTGSPRRNKKGTWILRTTTQATLLELILLDFYDVAASTQRWSDG